MEKLIKLKYISFTLALLFFVRCAKNTTEENHCISFHSLEIGSAEFYISEWNTDSIFENYVKETCDLQGRVTELSFYIDNNLAGKTFPNIPSIVKFEYDDKNIREFLYSENGEKMDAIKTEQPYSRRYYLDEDLRLIEGCGYELYFDKRKYSEKIISAFESNYVHHCPNFILFYSKSANKLNGRFPVSTSFQTSLYYFSESERESIVQSID